MSEGRLQLVGRCAALQSNAAQRYDAPRCGPARLSVLQRLQQAMSDEVAAATDPDLQLPDVHIIAHHAEPMRLKQRKVTSMRARA